MAIRLKKPAGYSISLCSRKFVVFKNGLAAFLWNHSLFRFLC